VSALDDYWRFMSHCNALVVTARTLMDVVSDQTTQKFSAHVLALLYVRMALLTSRCAAASARAHADAAAGCGARRSNA
jgi:hypothetical protein